MARIAIRKQGGREDPGGGGARRWRDRALALALALLPLLVGAGLLAPGFVRVLAIDAEAPEPVDYSRIRKPRRLQHVPLVAPYDFSVAFTPQVVDLDHLFFRTRYDASVARQSRQFAFPRSHGDVIVLDELSQSLPGFVFPESLVARALSAPGPGWPGIGGGFGGPVAGNGTLIDTPPFDPSTGTNGNGGPAPVIPEPGTGLLLGLGLLALAGRRR